MMMMVVVTVPTGNDDDARRVISSILAVMMVVVVVMIELHLLNNFVRGGDRSGLVHHLQQGNRVRNRFEQVRK